MAIKLKDIRLMSQKTPGKRTTKSTTKSTAKTSRSTSARSRSTAGTDSKASKKSRETGKLSPSSKTSAEATSTQEQQAQQAQAQQPQAPQPQVLLDQSVAILIDGNNIEMSLHNEAGRNAMINFDKLVPALLHNRALSRLIYFREGKSISQKLAERLQRHFHGSVVPCYKSADIPLTIKAVQVASKVDTIIILSGDADYVELVRHLKSDGIRVEVAAFEATTAEVLRRESDYFFPITVDYSFKIK